MSTASGHPLSVTRLEQGVLSEIGCAIQLVDEAHHRWLVEEEGVVDDITAVVVHFTYTNA